VVLAVVVHLNAGNENAIVGVESVLGQAPNENTLGGCGEWLWSACGGSVATSSFDSLMLGNISAPRPEQFTLRSSEAVKQ